MANDYGEKEIEASKNKAFELWPCEYPGTWIHLEHPEFTSICPDLVTQTLGLLWLITFQLNTWWN